MPDSIVSFLNRTFCVPKPFPIMLPWHTFHIRFLCKLICGINGLTILIHLHFPLLMKTREMWWRLAGIGQQLPEVAARVRFHTLPRPHSDHDLLPSYQTCIYSQTNTLTLVHNDTFSNKQWCRLKHIHKHTRFLPFKKMHRTRVIVTKVL